MKGNQPLNSIGRNLDGVFSQIRTQCECALCPSINIGCCACSTERTTACDNGKCDRNPCEG